MRAKALLITYSAGLRREEATGPKRRGGQYKRCLVWGCTPQFCSLVIWWGALCIAVCLAATLYSMSTTPLILTKGRSFSRILSDTKWEKVKTSIGMVLSPLGVRRYDNFMLHLLDLCHLLSWPSVSDVVTAYCKSSLKSTAQSCSRTGNTQ